MRKKINFGLLASTAVLALAFLAPCAHAQTNADKAAAEALFQAGRDLMGQSKFSEACEKFEASQRLDAGLGTLLYLADCYEKANRLASAWANYREAESIAMGRSDQGRATVARQRYTALEPRLSKLWIKVADGNDPATQVQRDGESIPRESWGIALPIDAGDHTIQATAPGRKAWSTKVVVNGEGANVPVEVPILDVAPAESAPAAPVTPVAPTPAAPPPETQTETHSNNLRPVSYVLGGVGIAGIALGSVFGFKAKAKNNDSHADCEPDNQNLCTQAGVDLRNDALSAARLSTAFMIGGGALLAGGIVLFAVTPSKSSSTGALGGFNLAAAAGPNAGRVTVEGAW